MTILDHSSGPSVLGCLHFALILGPWQAGHFWNVVRILGKAMRATEEFLHHFVLKRTAIQRYRTCSCKLSNWEQWKCTPFISTSYRQHSPGTLQSPECVKLSWRCAGEDLKAVRNRYVPWFPIMMTSIPQCAMVSKTDMCHGFQKKDVFGGMVIHPTMGILMIGIFTIDRWIGQPFSPAGNGRLSCAKIKTRHKESCGACLDCNMLLLKQP